MFEPFFTTKEVGRGTGMGLASVYGAVVANGGTIAVESELGHGTTVHLFFPLRRDIEVVAPTQDDAIQPQGKGTILVADDEDMVCRLLERILGDSGFDVMTAKDGQEAVDLHAVSGHEIDLCILDVVMPRLNGRDAMLQILAADPDARVLILTGHILEESGRGILADRAVDLLQKPFDTKDLLAKVAAVLSSRRPGSGGRQSSTEQARRPGSTNVASERAR